ncbi:MAG: hypothetical protein JWN50_753 [Parcubacteria group bacterium]|nr:hypothetical protein [Parcubacteria group bacterium]
MVALNIEQHLGTKAFVLFALEKMKWILVLIAVTLFLSIVRDATQYPVLASFVSFLELASMLSFVFGFVWAWLLYQRFTFTFEEFDIRMRSGIVIKKEVSIPYRQIQSVDIVRSVTHQMLGLSKLVLLTAGHEEADEKQLTEVVLEPIERSVAEDIRDMLQEKIGVQIVRPQSSL